MLFFNKCLKFNLGTQHLNGLSEYLLNISQDSSYVQLRIVWKETLTNQQMSLTWFDGLSKITFSFDVFYYLFFMPAPIAISKDF